MCMTYSTSNQNRVSELNWPKAEPYSDEGPTRARDIGTGIRKRYDNTVWETQPKIDNGEVIKVAPMVD